MDLGIRKKDLADRLQLLMRETVSTVELVNLLLKSCERIVNEVCDTDRFLFLSQYPVVIKFLDTRIHHALQFNCVTDNLISQDIKYDNEGVSIIESCNGAGDASQPPQRKLSEGPDLGVASIRFEGDCRPVPTLSEQASRCINVITHTPQPSQDNAMYVMEGADKTGRQDFGLHGSSDAPEGLINHEEQLEESQSNSNQSNTQNVSTNDINNIQKSIPSVNGKKSKNRNKQPSFVPESHLNKTAVNKLSILGHRTQNIAPPIIDGFPESVHRPLYVGEECAVMLSYIETPGEFYVHIACEENTTLDEFQEKMNAFYSENSVTLKTKSIAKTRLGNFCVCFQPEVGWCRAQILNWCLEEEHIEVQLVDYGDICIAFLDVIQPILPEYARQPIYATRCHLAFIEPPPPNDTWPPESAKVFNCYMPTTNKTKLIQESTLMQDIDIPRIYTIVKAEDDVMHVSGEENKVVHQTSISVILRDDSDSKKLTMNDNLVDLGYAGSPASAEAVDVEENVIDDIGLRRDKHNIVISDRRSDVENWVMNSLGSQCQLGRPNGEKPNVIKSEESPIDKSDLLQDWNPMQEDYLDPSESREDAVMAVSGYIAQDEKRVCKFFAKNGRCYKGIHCRMEHSFAHQDGYTTDKELVYTHAFTPLTMPAEDSVIRIMVTHVPKGKNYFYSIMPNDLQSSRPDEETLATLNKHINEPRIIKTFSHLQIPPALGQMVLAFSKADSSWHRARVVAELDDGNDTIEVVFVDSGEMETIHEKCVRAIEPSMLHLPFQAIECHLANVDIDNLLMASEFFQALCLGKTLIAKVIRSLEDVQVMYCLLLDSNGKDMGQLLIQAGLGFEKASNSQLIMMPL